MDIVKPIPAIIAAPVMIPQLVFAGNSEMPNFTKRAEKLKMPMHFPTISPVTIPIETGSNKPLQDSDYISIPAFAEANKSNIKNETTRFRLYSNFCKGVSTFSLSYFMPLVISCCSSLKY